MKTLITETKAINQAIDSIARRGKKLDEDIQHVGLSVIQHADTHGDITLINRLYLAMPRGSRRSALTHWLLAFAKVSANTGEDKKEKPFIFNRMKETDMVGAVEMPWYNCKPDAAPDEVFDLDKALTALLKRAEGKRIATPDQAKRLETVKALLKA